MLNFVILITAIHYLYSFFTHQFDFAIHHIFGVYNWFNDTVYNQSKFVLGLIVPVKSEGQKFVFENKDSIEILFPCTGVQPILQFAMLILLYPGPWKHKIWYIPFGMIVLHLTNVFRIIGLGIVMAYWPEHWYYAHDYPFRIILYVILFILWLIWNDKFYRATNIKELARSEKQ
jgi:exosortase/archaeosortase family protein